MGPITNIDELFQHFREVVILDTEYIANDGERPVPVCAVAYELRSKQRHRLWTYGKATTMTEPPWADGDDVLTVVFYGLAEFGFYLSMGWKMPTNVLDLHAAYCWFKNGRKIRNGNGSRNLLGAMDAFGLDSMLAEEKDFWRNLIIQRAWTEEQKPGLLTYCEKDVICTTRLFYRMIELIDWPRELHRGNFVKALSLIEMRGIPVDLKTLEKIKVAWPLLKEELMDQANRIHPFYENGSFKLKLFDQYLLKEKIQWERTSTGKPTTSSDYFKTMSVARPDIAKLREIRDTISSFKNLKLTIGQDGRNRFMQSPFGTITGRNTPSNAKNIYGAPKWMRLLIQPPKGYGMAYCDWSGNEVGVASYLSQDPLMMEMYESPDFYTSFAKHVKHAPADATKKSHPLIREKFKTLSLALMYGQGPRGIAERLDIILPEAEALVRLHKRTFRVFWEWSDQTVSKALLHKKIVSPHGWQYHVRSDDFDENGNKEGPNLRRLQNWSMQTAGSEMMRSACIKLAETNIAAVAVVHDAFLVIDVQGKIDETAEKTRQCMADASADVLHGHPLKTDKEVFFHPERFPEPRGEAVWDMVQKFLEEHEPKQGSLL